MFEGRGRLRLFTFGRFGKFQKGLGLLEKRRVAFVSSQFGTMRHTCEHGREQLSLWGIGAEVFRVEEMSLPEALSPFDLIILNRVPLSAGLESALRVGCRRGAVVLGDLDDLLLDEETVFSLSYFREQSREARERFRNLARGLRGTFALSSHVLCYTSAIEKELVRLGYRPLRVNICASGEMVEAARQARERVHPSPGAVTIGFSPGHPGHVANLRSVSNALNRVFALMPAARLTLLGGLEPPEELNPFRDRIEVRPWVDWRELPAEIRRFDITIAPLEDCVFNTGKSHLKYLEASLCKVPIVASGLSQLGETIRDGVTGRLARTEEDWVNCLLQLGQSAELRARLARRAHADVLKRLTARACAASYVAALGRALLALEEGR